MFIKNARLTTAKDNFLRKTNFEMFLFFPPALNMCFTNHAQFVWAMDVNFIKKKEPSHAEAMGRGVPFAKHQVDNEELMVNVDG